MSITQGIERKAQARSAPHQYQAFTTGSGKQTYFRLYLLVNEIHTVHRYDRLDHIFESGTGDFIGLVLGDMQIKLYGRELRPIVNALCLETLTEICMFDAGGKTTCAPGQTCVKEIFYVNLPVDPIGEVEARKKALE